MKSKTCVGRPNNAKLIFFDLRANLILTKVNISHHKSMQVYAIPGQTETQVNASWKLASTPVWPGLNQLAVYMLWPRSSTWDCQEHIQLVAEWPPCYHFQNPMHSLGPKKVMVQAPRLPENRALSSVANVFRAPLNNFTALSSKMVRLHALQQKSLCSWALAITPSPPPLGAWLTTAAVGTLQYRYINCVDYILYLLLMICCQLNMASF